jgi:formiminoglutamate deiminase
MTVFWCEFAWLGAVDGRVESGVLIDVAGDRIAAVTTGVTEVPAAAVRLPGLTLPGMVNGHSHAFHRGLRGRTHGGTGTFWTWRNQMYALADRLDPDSYRALAIATFAEMVQAGFTTVGEFHYLHHGPAGVPYADTNEMSRVLVEAASIAGIRITLLDTCYLQAGLSGDAKLNATQLRFSDGTAKQWMQRVADASIESPTAKLGAALHSVRAVPRPAIAEVAAWSSARSRQLHAHVSEQPAENEQCFAAHGATPTELLHSEGALTDRFTAVHATHLTANDRALYDASGATCCICPTTERDLADGIGPTAAFRSEGVAMSIGSDSHAVIDPFEEIRAIEMNQRLATLTRGTHQPAELLAVATSQGARSLGWPDAGRIVVDALADLTTVSLASPRLAGSDTAHLAAAVVFGATAADVHHVIVGGRVIVSGGAHRSIDVSRALTESIEVLTR